MSKTNLPAVTPHSCNPEHRFAGAGKPITGGKFAVQVIDDCHLSRFVCCPIAQSGVVS